MIRWISLSALVLVLTSFSGQVNKWFVAGSHPKAYYMGLDSTAVKNGAMPSTIRSLQAQVDGFGTIMNYHKPGDWLGHTIRMTGYMKSKDVKEWAGFWLRLDGEKNESLGFDNMGDRPVTKTTEWKKYTIEMEVPHETIGIAYGALLDGPGQIWFADVQFEIIK